MSSSGEGSETVDGLGRVEDLELGVMVRIPRMNE